MKVQDSIRFARDYIEFQKDSADPFHVVKRLKERFSACGFKETDLSSQKRHQAGERYLIPHQDGKSLLAVIIGQSSPCDTGFGVVGSHTDSPVLRLRLNPWAGDRQLLKLETQCHGGLIARSWLDRPLKISGAVWQIARDSRGQILMDKNSSLPMISRKLVRSRSPIAVIPDLSIHLDSSKNSVGEINQETMLAAFVSSNIDREEAIRLFWEELGTSRDSVDGFELSLSPWQNHELTGAGQCYITGPRHDDLAMVFCSSEALCHVAQSETIPQRTAVAAFFDAEETGSQTCSGAASSFARDALLRLAELHEKSSRPDQAFAAAARSFLISADMAHAFHPAYPGKFDQNHRLVVNGGMVLKENANDRYATSGGSGTIFRALCELAKVPVQPYINRQDISCGSTIGPILSAKLGCPAVDAGLAMWGMHSTGETMGTYDLSHASQLFQVFFSGGLAS